MAGSSFFMLLDDIAALLDDVAVMSKKAVSKTAGVLGDDLALNAQQVSGVTPDRELPVVWAVAKGSAINKVILVPVALALSAFLPVLIAPLLMLGGAYLCFEGVEKIYHSWFHKDEAHAHEVEHIKAVDDETVDLVQMEKDKIKGAVRTDFILSAEIIVISLGTLVGKTIMEQSLTLTAVAIIMTVGVYGLVAGIVKLDDVGLYLSRSRNVIAVGIGRFLLAAAPKLMRFLSIAGTIAMFLVGGAIIAHNIPYLHHMLEAVETYALQLATGGAGTTIKLSFGLLYEFVVGAVVGVICLLGFNGVKKVIGK
jgi:uncharacterized protein